MSPAHLRGELSLGGGCGKKLIAGVEWQETKSSDCPGCRDLYADRVPPQSPPCDECRVELLEENFDAAKIYHLTKRQVRTAGGSGEIVDLDYTAVKHVMDLYEIKDQREVFGKVTRLFHHFLNERRQRSG